MNQEDQNKLLNQAIYHRLQLLTGMNCLLNGLEVYGMVWSSGVSDSWVYRFINISFLLSFILLTDLLG